MKNIRVVIGRTNKAESSQGYTYNEAGLTYNHSGLLYGGLYGGDVYPLTSRSKEIKPTIHTSGDVGVPLEDYIKALSGLVAYYPLGELSGNAVNIAPATVGTMDGVVSGAVQGAAGQSGNAYVFDATDKISITSEAAANSLTAVSIAALININSAGGGGFGRLIQKGDNAVGYWDINTLVGSINFTADFATQDLVARIVIPSSAWVYLVFTYTGGATAASDVVGYINGVAQAHSLNQDGTGGRNADSTHLTIANRFSDTARVFDGKAQHIAVFNRILSSSEALRMAQLAGLA